MWVQSRFLGCNFEFQSNMVEVILCWCCSPGFSYLTCPCHHQRQGMSEQVSQFNNLLQNAEVIASLFMGSASIYYKNTIHIMYYHHAPWAMIYLYMLDTKRWIISSCNACTSCKACCEFCGPNNPKNVRLVTCVIWYIFLHQQRDRNACIITLKLKGPTGALGKWNDRLVHIPLTGHVPLQDC